MPLSARIHAMSNKRMPPLASLSVGAAATDVPQSQEPDVHMDSVAGNSLLVSVGVNRPAARSTLRRNTA